MTIHGHSYSDNIDFTCPDCGEKDQAKMWLAVDGILPYQPRGPTVRTSLLLAGLCVPGDFGRARTGGMFGTSAEEAPGRDMTVSIAQGRAATVLCLGSSDSRPFIISASFPGQIRTQGIAQLLGRERALAKYEPFSRLFKLCGVWAPLGAEFSDLPLSQEEDAHYGAFTWCLNESTLSPLRNRG